MIKVKPRIEAQFICPRCGGNSTPRGMLWQGIHVAAVTTCANCNVETIADFPIGQAAFTPYQVDLANKKIYGDSSALGWFGMPFLESLCHPEQDSISLQVEKRTTISNAVILNCLDYLYGHALLKLLNADAHQPLDAKTGLVVLVPRFLRWMVPDHAAEVWTVDIPLAKAQAYFPQLHDAIEAQLGRFDEVYLSPAHSHPGHFNITRFTGERPCELDSTHPLITFIWREDRLWAGRWTGKLLRLCGLACHWQNFKITRLFREIKRRLPQATFAIAGLGKRTRFPEWIQDARVTRFDAESEKQACQLYARSALVVGVHGSNMLLPSAHAWATVDLMPEDRWPNFAQDILCQGKNEDSRITLWRYRFLPLRSATDQIAWVACSTLRDGTVALRQFKSTPPVTSCAESLD